MKKLVLLMILIVTAGCYGGVTIESKPTTLAKKVDDGGYAFPRSGNSNQGMTLLDYFAGQVLAGGTKNAFGSQESQVKYAYEVARKMINHRNKLLEGNDES